MSNKSLRILIADEQHFNRLRIERWFNQLNYFRIAPVQNLDELLSLVEYGGEPFDLLVINAALPGGKLDLLDYCLDNRQLDRVLIYDGQQAQLPFAHTEHRHRAAPVQGRFDGAAQLRHQFIQRGARRQSLE